MVADDKFPKGWQLARLGDICQINPCRPYGLKRKSTAPTTFVPMSAVDATSGIITGAETRPYAEVQKGYTYFEEGDVLFAKITPCMQNGEHVIATDLIDGIGFGTTEFHVLRPNESVTNHWVHRFIRQPSVLHAAVAHFKGAVGQQRVPKEFLADLTIPLPPLPEQKRIAAILNEQLAAVEKARAAAEAQLEAARSLPAAYLQEIFNAHETNKKVRLGDIATIINGRAYSSQELLSYGKYQVLRVGNLFTNKHWYFSNLTLDPTKYCEKGDLLYAWSASFGPFIWEGPKVIYHYHIWKVCCSEAIMVAYAYFALKVLTDSIMRSSHGLAMLHMTKEKMEDIRITVPPLCEQKRIVDTINQKMGSVEAITIATKGKFEALNAMPAALLRQAFRGEM